jgi:uncharacterized membrane protein YqjE
VSNERAQARGIGELLRDLAQGSGDLLRGELQLARLELTEIATTAARGAIAVTLGAVLLLLGALSLAVGFVLVVGDQWLPRDSYWLGALAVVVVTSAVAFIFARRGMHQLSPAQLAPDQTLETLREDKEWLKRQLTSGATSK